jgi:uncharacterized protein
VTHRPRRLTAMRIRWFLILLPSLFASVAALRATEVMPPAPTRYFNDYTLTVSGPVGEELNKQLADFERQTSNQIVVAVLRKAETDSSIQDYCHRIFESWKVGRAGLNNGCVLFVFKDDRKVWIEVGYGLEGAIPDGTVKQIIDTVITPKFKVNDFDGGLRDGVNALIAAARGEYKGTGKTTGEERRRTSSKQGIPLWLIVVLVVLFFIVVSRFSQAGQGRVFDADGHRNVRTGPIFWGGGFGGGSWGGGGGGGGGSDGGGFFGGGGSSGGGGAGGDW